MLSSGEIVKIEYEKDENYFPKGIKFFMKNGSVKELHGELAADLIFLLSLKRLNVKKTVQENESVGSARDKVKYLYL